MKICKDCGKEKNESDFFKSKLNKGGLTTCCKICHRIRCKKWEEKNKEKIIGYWKKYNYKRVKKICEICGNEFVRNGTENGCSISCRLLNNINKNENGCWEWRRSINARGYGQINFKRKPKETHRVSYMTFKGEIPAGFCVLHTCDNRKCINPDHLYIGTKKDNARDMLNRNRHPYIKRRK